MNNSDNNHQFIRNTNMNVNLIQSQQFQQKEKSREHSIHHQSVKISDADDDSIISDQSNPYDDDNDLQNFTNFEQPMSNPNIESNNKHSTVESKDNH